jgi:NADPH2 dehydrogenase
MLESLDIPLVNITLGSPYWNPHLQRPAAYPPSDGYLPPTDPLLMVGQHLAVTRALVQACPKTTFIGTGYTYLQEWLPHVAQHEVAAGHVQMIGLGRLVLSYPDLPRDVLAGRPLQRKRICRTFSDCTTGPRNGMLSGCFPLDPYYSEMPEAARVKAINQENRR